MRILVVGSGGREHTIGWKIAQSSSVKKIYFAPGNGGTSQLGENIDIKADDIESLADFALKNSVDLTIIGPEVPLSMGIVDLFQKKNLPIFGPMQYAAQLESSKAWAVEFMRSYKIPHPDSYIIKTFDEAIKFVSKPQWKQYVIKADGLAGGKGVHLPATQKDAEISVRQMMIDKIYGDAGNILVFQEKIIGPEVSVVTIVDGQNYHILPLSQDHKRVFDHDKGPNTGGMGSYTPTPFVSKKLFKKIESEIIQPTIMGMKQNNHPYNGFLYFGLMIVEGSPFVIEYNVRLGDPETQSQLPLIESDFVEILQSCIRGSLSSLSISHQAAVCVVLAAPGYPGKIETGQIVHNAETIQNSKSVLVFHAGTSNENGVINVTSGRSFNVVGLGKNIKEAQTNVYKAIGKKNNGVYFDNMHYRKDIANYAI